VLFLDDEVPMLRSIARALAGESFGKEFYSSAQEALAALEKQRFTVVVSDLNMPGMSGLEFLTHTKKTYPHMIRIIATGVTDLSEVLTAIRTGETHRYISKPVNIEEELLPTLQQTFELYDMQRTQERLTEELIVLNTHLQHQKEEIAFFKDLTEQSNKRKEALLSRFLAVFPSLVGAIEKTLPLIGPESPPDMIALADLYSAQREQIRLLNQDLRDNLITLECLPANLL
jgi:FixJ family two-component response regulator